MKLDRVELPEIVRLDDLARALRVRLDELVQLLRGETAEELEAEPPPEIQRTDLERLSPHFYTRATALQETLMRSEEGLAIVIGVAGSGKTSVALGRTKMLVDHVPEDGDKPFYTSETAMGFVLTGQLCDYLEKTCQQLALYDMPVQEFHQLRARLFELRRLDETGFAQSIGDRIQPLLGTMAWLRAADETIARALVGRIRDAVLEPPKERETSRKVVAKRSPAQESALIRLWTEMVTAMEGVLVTLPSLQAGYRFCLERLASKLDAIRRRFAEALEKAPEFGGATNRDLRQNVRSALRERLIRALRLPDAYALALTGERRTTFAEVARRHTRAEEHAAADIAVTEASLRVGDRKLSEADVDVLLALAHVLSMGYRGRDDRDPISHLTEPEWHSQVFIDEFQDFSEVQLFLMGLQANPERRTVTVVGDYMQKLRGGRRIDLAVAFPWAEGSETEAGVLLENKRQIGPLAELSQRFREAILSDAKVDIEFSKSGDRARFIDVSSDDIIDAICQEVLRLPRHLSIAVICATDATARDLERSLRDALGSNFRDTRHSKRGDLLQRFYVHFTTPLEAKGLEFDAAIVARLGDFDLQNAEQANGCYVAFSRPRAALSLVGEHASLDQRLRTLVDSGARGSARICFGARCKKYLMPVSREQLHAEVWAEPVAKVAKRYEVSGSFLARVCERLNVPRPPVSVRSTAPESGAVRRRARLDDARPSPDANAPTT